MKIEIEKSAEILSSIWTDKFFGLVVTHRLDGPACSYYGNAPCALHVFLVAGNACEAPADYSSWRQAFMSGRYRYKR